MVTDKLSAECAAVAYIKHVYIAVFIGIFYGNFGIFGDSVVKVAVMSDLQFVVFFCMYIICRFVNTFPYLLNVHRIV